MKELKAANLEEGVVSSELRTLIALLEARKVTNILVLGYSKIFVKRVLPALLYIDKCINIDVASASHAQEQIISNRKIRNTYVNYDYAIRNSNADWVYISTVNSLHEN